ncbi:MAG: CAP domain-containing protein [Pseudomonadota bacterium]
MKFRVAGLAALAVAAAPPALAVCDIDIDQRAERAAEYVPQARACLAAPPRGFWFDGEQERQIFDLVNEERRKAGLPALALRPELADAARFHALDLAVNEYFEHDGLDGRSPADRIALLDRRLIVEVSRENLASFQGPFDISQSASILHRNLMDSPGHRKNILAEDVDHAAMGLVLTRRGAWVTQLFVKEAGELNADLPPVLRPGALFPMQADLATWSFDSFQLGREAAAARFETQEREIVPRAPTAPPGEARLHVRGMLPTEEPRRFRVIELPGPAVTIVATGTGGS